MEVIILLTQLDTAQKYLECSLWFCVWPLGIILKDQRLKKSFRKLRIHEVEKSLNYKKYSILKRKKLKVKMWDFKNMRWFVLWENRAASCLLSTMPQGRTRPHILAPGVTDRMSGHMKELRCQKREQAASMDSTLRGFTYQAGNRIRYSLLFLHDLRICVIVICRTYKLPSTQTINVKANIESNGRHNSLYLHQ